jgi:hypothetical protein
LGVVVGSFGRLCVFVLAATANGAGYRYGVSDQAFYIPVVVRALQPAAFPRDASLIDSQGRLMLSDEILAASSGHRHPARVSVSCRVPVVAAADLAGRHRDRRRLFRVTVVDGRLRAAITLRHRIPRTTANSFEPYFHPRMLAFGSAPSQ